MEFKFRAVDDRPPPPPPPHPTAPSTSNYVSKQALRVSAGFSTTNPRPNLEQIQIPNDTQEAIVQRELEKAQIREEIIAAEITRRRLLEAEVRRELMIEREMALRRLSAEGGISFEYGLSMHTFEGGFAFPSCINAFNMFPMLPLLRLPEAMPVDVRPPSETNKDKLIVLAKPTPNVSGAKRKAETASAGGTSELPPFGLKKRPKEEWSCAICQVSVSSERALNEHLQGRKHKAKEAGLRAQRTGRSTSSTPLTKKTTMPSKQNPNDFQEATTQQRELDMFPELVASDVKPHSDVTKNKTVQFNQHLTNNPETRNRLLPRRKKGGPQQKSDLPWSARRENLSENERILKTAADRILNKHTPAKFDRPQDHPVYRAINSAETLVGTVSLIYNKAVTEPAYCPMYALLCSDLNQKLPSFPSDVPGGRNITVTRVLLNKCQETFEGVDELTKEIRRMTAPEQTMDLRVRERMLKRRFLGNIQLIGELMKQKIMNERIVHHVVQELLGPADSKFQPNENVKALCQLLITVGKQFDESPTSRCKNDEYFRQLNDMSTSTQLAPLLRFMIRYLLELRSNNWVARPEEVKAKNITEKYSESQNLGDTSPGGFLPMTKTIARLISLQRKTVSLVEEYFIVRLLDKALKCVKELNSPAYHPEVVKEAISLGLEKSPPCSEPVAKLLEYLFAEKVLADGDIELGCLLYGSMLDDVSLDVPKAPDGFGKIIGKLVLAGVLDFTVVNKVVMKVEDERLQKTISIAAVRIANSTSGQSVLE
ncbi:hypothetical protein CMV_017027 [Castanea mollissima]|uniref:MI domain-containing protein n=1 Tax=Castanea mollissima TaxID=60419 RepID=A0A8J4R2V8_9ROSI|nr:hypothetical protein CMV_017027 [Castanea mollissima]